MLKVAICGITGRMGGEIVSAISRARKQGEEIEVVVGLASGDDPSQGRELTGVRLPVTMEWPDEIAEVDVIIDFSSEQGTVKALEAAYQFKKPLLVGTTGLGSHLDMIFGKTATVAPLLRASNTSIGVNVMLQIVHQATQMLGGQFDIEISEVHHRMKKDAPSGTAKILGEAVASARDSALEVMQELNRSSANSARKPNSVGMSTLRGGDVVGEHTVFFFGNGERLEITHRATNRAIFAEGALRAARWLTGDRAPGLYSMRDVLSV